MNRCRSEEIFYIDMASRTETALDQLNHIIDTTFSSIDKCERFNRYTSLQSLHTALDHQLHDGMMSQLDSYRIRFVVRQLWNLKLQIHMIDKECAQLCDVIGHFITLMLDLFSEGVITRSLFVCTCAFVYKMIATVAVAQWLSASTSEWRRFESRWYCRSGFGFAKAQLSMLNH